MGTFYVWCYHLRFSFSSRITIFREMEKKMVAEIGKHKEESKAKDEDGEKRGDTAEKLIQMVDDEWKPLGILESLQANFTNLIYLIAVATYAIIAYYAIRELLPFVGQEPSAFLAIILTICAFIVQFTLAIKELTEPLKREELMRITTEWNYKRIKNRVKDEHRLLLKALIKMKTLQRDFKLSEVRKKYPSLFNEAKLVGRLYNLSFITYPEYSSEKTKTSDT